MKKRIILGDRKSLARMAYKGTLEASGYEVAATFTKGVDMLALCQQHKPDLVLSSAILAEPGGNVLALLPLLRDSDPGVQVLLYANTCMYSREDCLGAGATDFFEYPARPDEMLAAVRKVIG